MVRSVRHEQAVTAEAVEHNACQRVFKPQLHAALLPAEHAEHLLGIDGRVKGARLVVALARDARRRDLRHLVHAVVRQAVRRAVGHEIIVLVLPAQRDRACLIGLRPEAAPALQIPVKIAERDAAVPGDSRMQRIDIAADVLAAAFGAAGNDDLAPQQLRFVRAREGGELADQGHGLLFGEEPRRLHGVDEQLQL